MLHLEVGIGRLSCLYVWRGCGRIKREALFLPVAGVLLDYYIQGAQANAILCNFHVIVNEIEDFTEENELRDAFFACLVCLNGQLRKENKGEGKRQTIR